VRALLKKQLGKDEQALNDLGLAIRTTPELGEAYLLQAQLYLSKGDPENAAQVIETWQKPAP
jgi:Tfp pilus assembly protein PilF